MDFFDSGLDYYQKSITELAKKNIQLEIINQITKCITIEMSFDEMMETISKTLREIIEFDLLSFCVIENQRKLIIKNGIPKKIEDLEEGEVLKGKNSNQSAPWRVIKDKRCLIRANITKDEYTFAEDQALINFGIQSAIIVPLIVKKRVIGTLNLGSKKERIYEARDAVFLEQVAAQLAVCFENARLYIEENKIKSEWEDTFKAVTDIFYLIDSNYTLIRCNQFTADFGLLKGVKPEIGKPCYSFFGESGQKCENCPAKDVFQSGKSALKRSYSKLGVIWDGYAYPLFNPEGKVERVIVVGKDVTKRVELETQLNQSAKLADMGIITASIAHELNSPLTAIIGNSLLLEKDGNNFSEDQKELLEDIKKCGIRCKDIIQTVQNFARKEKYCWEPVVINDVVSGALKLISYQIQKSNIKLISNLAPGIPSIKASRQQLEQLVVNFLLNARDAVENRSKSFIVIITGYDNEENRVFLSVQDNGCGMHQEELPNIFNAFYTAKSSSGGNGLGLSICKRIAEEHNGSIEVTTEKGKGSTFTLMLPQWHGGEAGA